MIKIIQIQPFQAAIEVDNQGKIINAPKKIIQLFKSAIFYFRGIIKKTESIL